MSEFDFDFDFSFASPWQILVVETGMTAKEQELFTLFLTKRGMGRDKELTVLQTQHGEWKKLPTVKAAPVKGEAPSEGDLSEELLKEFCKKLGESEVDLDDWTAKFTADMAKSRYPLSPKQRTKLEKMFGELRDKVKM